MIQSTHFQFEPLALPKRRPTAFLVSLCLHLVAGALLFGFAKVTNVPFGVNKRGSPTYIELASPSRTHFSPSVAKPTKQMTGDVAIKSRPLEPRVPSPAEPQLESTEPQLKPAATQFGNENGTVAQGDLGEATGFKATSLERYLYELRVILANRKIYPATSKRLGETGRVIVKFNIRRSGAIENLALQKPSDYSRLNEAALKLVSTVEKYKPFPEEEKTETLAVEVPIDYVLN